VYRPQGRPSIGGIVRRILVVVMLLALAGVVAGGGAQAAPSNAWSVVATPSRPGPVVSSGLRSVACPTATRCVTVGQYDDGANFLPIVGHSTGGAWSMASASVPPGRKFPFGKLVGVACPTSTLCFGVGDYESATATFALIERWNGANWAIVPTSVPGTMSLLSAISCPTSTSCFAVGYRKPGNGHRTLVEHWDGSTWSSVGTPNPKGSLGSYLYGLGCRPTICFAVGHWYHTPTVAQGLIERYA